MKMDGGTRARTYDGNLTKGKKGKEDTGENGKIMRCYFAELRERGAAKRRIEADQSASTTENIFRGGNGFVRNSILYVATLSTLCSFDYFARDRFIFPSYSFFEFRAIPGESFFISGGIGGTLVQKLRESKI